MFNILMTDILRIEASNSIFEKHESCDKCCSWDSLTDLGGIVKGALSGATGCCLFVLFFFEKILVANDLVLPFITLSLCLWDCDH